MNVQIWKKKLAEDRAAWKASVAVGTKHHENTIISDLKAKCKKRSYNQALQHMSDLQNLQQMLFFKHWQDKSRQTLQDLDYTDKLLRSPAKAQRAIYTVRSSLVIASMILSIIFIFMFRYSDLDSFVRVAMN